MATTYPGTIQSITDYAGTYTLAAADHANWHATTSDTVEALETVIGTCSGTSIAKNFAAGDFAARINSSNVLQQAVSGTVSVLAGSVVASAGTINNFVVGTPAITGGTATSLNLVTPLTDTISEKTPAAGVTIDSLLIKDGRIPKLSFGTPTELTIAAGAVTVTASWHYIDTEGDASSDDLFTINGGNDGDILIITAASNDRDVVLKDYVGTTDNLFLAGDFTLTRTTDTIVLMKSVTSAWIELSRSDNTA